MSDRGHIRADAEAWLAEGIVPSGAEKWDDAAVARYFARRLIDEIDGGLTGATTNATKQAQRAAKAEARAERAEQHARITFEENVRWVDKLHAAEAQLETFTEYLSRVCKEVDFDSRPDLFAEIEKLLTEPIDE
jgi:hypothetical protein